MVEAFSHGVVLEDGQIQDQRLNHGKVISINLLQIQIFMLMEPAMYLVKDLQKQLRQILTMFLWMQMNG